MSGARHAAGVVVLTGVVLLGGCVYYNGMYNTNRLAKSARKAERDGRQFEAQSLWGQVVTRADSLVLRHPRSKYADQATVLRGLALARLNQCPDAVGPLGRSSVVELSTDLAEEAAMALGRCQLELGDASMADLAFARVVRSADSARAREARFRHAHALRMAGRNDEALALLEESPDPRGHEDLVLALAATGRTDQALAVADSLLAARDSSIAWDSVVSTVGRRDVKAASALVTRLGDDPRAVPAMRAYRLYEDALRLLPLDTAAGVERLRQAARVPGSTEGGERARLRLVRMDLNRARTLEEIAPLADTLGVLATRNSEAAVEAGALEAQIRRLRQLADSAGPGQLQGDLRLFLGAEAARDSLHSPALAAALFRRMGDDWPTSPYAPKALLAAEQLDPSDDETTRARLDSLYYDSPYLALVRGEEAAGYRVLEDSLEAFAEAQPLVRPQRARPGVRRPTPDGRAVDEDKPTPRGPGVPAPTTPNARRRPLEP